MAVRPGEDLAATLFADIHYYYGPPTANPPHHRFDKGSYVYLFENAGQRRARIEIANNAGKPGQDAFNGYGQDGRRNSSTSADTQEWHLPIFDPKNENKYMYRLHTLDIYFWTKEDALQFVNGLRRVLSQHQVAIQDEPIAPPAHSDAMSPVVQQLEKVAISDPSYQQGRTRDSRTTSTSFAGPPGSALPNEYETSNFSPSSAQQPTPAAPQPQAPATFVPLAYNPAAPAAPEAIKHREKTPPPEDGMGNPLVAAATSDHGQTYGVPFQQQGGFSGPPSSQSQSQQSYFPGPPGPPAGPPPTQVQQPQQPQQPQQHQQHQQHQQPTPPMQSPMQSPFAQHFQNTFPGPPTGNMPGPPAYKAQPSPHNPGTQFANYPGSPGISAGMTSPGIYAPGLTSPGFTAPGLASPGFSPPASSQGGYTSSAPPPGGFSQYSYAQGNSKPLMSDYSVHQQVYRPTEGENGIKHNEKPKVPKPAAGKLEQRAGQLEKGVTGLFKKLEKKYG